MKRVSVVSQGSIFVGVLTAIILVVITVLVGLILGKLTSQTQNNHAGSIFQNSPFMTAVQPVTVRNFPTSFNVHVDNPVTIPEPTPLQATTPHGVKRNVITSHNGALHVDVPRSHTDNVMIDRASPIFQHSASNGINRNLVSITKIGNSAVTAPESAFRLETFGIGSIASIQSRKRVPYRTGQGSRFIFTARFDNVSAGGTFQITGPGTAEDGVYFGYRIGQFGILYTQRGKREVQTLHVTAGSSTDENVEIILNGVVYNVPVTNSGDVQRTVYEITTFSYTGWRSEPRGSDVLFIQTSAIPPTGHFNFSATTAVASFEQTRPGKAVIQEWIPQSDWNLDTCENVFHPEFFNTYMISLDGGSASFFIQAPDASYIHVHQMHHMATHTQFANPSFPITMAVYNIAPVNCTAELSSMAGFVEGTVKYSGNRYSISNTISGVDKHNIYTLFTVRNAQYFNEKSNQNSLTLVAVSGSLKHNQPATLMLYKSNVDQVHNLGGNPDFKFYSETTSILVDMDSTTFIPTLESQLIWTGEIGETGQVALQFTSDLEQIKLAPGESLSLCATTRGGTVSWTGGSIDLREDY